MAEEKKIDEDKMDEVVEKDDSQAASTMRFEIKKWNAVALWSCGNFF